MKEISINIKNYGLTPEQLENFALEYYAQSITGSKVDTIDFSFEEVKYAKEFKEILDSTFLIEKKKK